MIKPRYIWNLCLAMDHMLSTAVVGQRFSQAKSKRYKRLRRLLKHAGGDRALLQELDRLDKGGYLAELIKPVRTKGSHSL